MNQTTKLPTVLITNTMPASTLQPLAGLARLIQGPDGGPLMPRAEVLAHAPTLVGIINQGALQIDEQLLDRAPHLKIVSSVSIGINHMDIELMAARGVWATNVPDAFTAAVADYTLGLLISLARRLLLADRYLRAGQWPDDGFQPGVWDGVLLCGKTLGIVGYGRTGQAVAQRARAFGMDILYFRRQPRDDPEYRPLTELLRDADFVSLHMPLTPETHHLMNARRLAMMKPGAYLINMGRGAVVDEVALVNALQQKHLAGAALDVFEHEPHVHAALLAMDHVILSPHIGGGTVESRRAARLLCAQNVAAVLLGQRPLTPVNEPYEKMYKERKDENI